MVPSSPTVLNSETTSAPNEPLGPDARYTSKRLAASVRSIPIMAAHSISLVEGRLDTGASHLKIKYCSRVSSTLVLICWATSRLKGLLLPISKPPKVRDSRLRAGVVAHAVFRQLMEAQQPLTMPCIRISSMVSITSMSRYTPRRGSKEHRETLAED